MNVRHRDNILVMVYDWKCRIK